MSEEQRFCWGFAALFVLFLIESYVLWPAPTITTGMLIGYVIGWTLAE